VGILPVGYRPPALRVAAVPMGDPATVWRLDIAVSGTVVPYVAAVNGNWVSLDGVSFSVKG
jgi:hypothetical protein